MDIHRQSTSLNTEIHESSLVWEIENFLDYPHYCVKELPSELIEFKQYDASWKLSVFPQTDDDKVALKFKMIDFPCSRETLLKFEVRAEVTSGDHSTHTNHMYLKSLHPDMKAAVWSQDYWPVNKNEEIWCDNFIDHKAFPHFYLHGGMLTINVNIWLKSVGVEKTNDTY